MLSLDFQQCGQHYLVSSLLSLQADFYLFFFSEKWMEKLKLLSGGGGRALLGGKRRLEGRLRLVAVALGPLCETAARSEVWRLHLTALLFLRVYF